MPASKPKTPSAQQYGIPNASDDEYAGTDLETPEQRAKQRAAELFAASDDENWLGI